MIFVSLTRLRIRSLRFLPAFALHTLRAKQQVRKSPGFQRGALLVDRQWTFWTLTAWDSPESMRQYMISGAHKEAMPHLLEWCDEASVVHWEQADTAFPSWEEAHRQMISGGRASKVRKPSPEHATLNFPVPRTTVTADLLPS